MMRKISLLLLVWVCLGGLRAAERPNIVWIVSEDHSPLTGAYAASGLSTPHLDQLSAEGLVFDNAFAPAPVCAPARFALITGRYASAHPGAEGMRGWHDLSEAYEFFPKYLRDVGYYTANWGKEDYNTGRYLGGDINLARQAAWDESVHKWVKLNDETLKLGGHWRNRPDPAMPFFQMFNLIDTHEGELRNEGTAEKPRHDPAEVVLPPYRPDTALGREDMAFFLDRLEEMDEKVGVILEDLEEDGLLDDSILFWFSDHGGNLVRSKRYLYDSGTRVPLVVWFGKNFRHLAPETLPGREQGLVSFVDMAPTVLNLLGIEIPEAMHGRPFLGDNLPPARETVFLHRQRMSEQILLSRAVHDGRYLYIRHFLPRYPLGPPTSFPLKQIPSVREWGELGENALLPAVQRAGLDVPPVEELYDTHWDPHTIQNLRESTAYAGVLSHMRSLLKEQMLESQDVGLYWTFSNELTPPETILEMALTASQPEEADVEVLRKMLGSKDPAQRFWGASGLSELGEAGRALEQDLEPLLSDPEQVVRVMAAEAWLRIGVGRSDLVLPVFAEALQTYGRPQPSPALWTMNILLQHAPDLIEPLEEDWKVFQGIKGFESRMLPRLEKAKLHHLQP